MRKIFLINLIMALFIIAILSLNSGAPGKAAVAEDAAAAGDASSYYVSTEGSDSNPGTEKKPWETIQKAAETAGPGSTVYIKAGTYYERINIKVSGNKKDGAITFTNYKDGSVIIDGSKSTAKDQEELIRISNKSNIILDGLELVNNTNKEKKYFIMGIGVWGKGDGIEIRNCRIHHIYYTGASKDAGAQGIGVYGRDEEIPISGLVLDGNEIWDIKSGTREAVAISGNVDGFHLMNNEIHDTNNTGLALIGDGKLKGEPVCAEASVNRARNGLVENNKTVGNSRVDNPCYPKNDYGAAGIAANGARDTIVAYNLSSENDIGIKIGNETSNKLCSGITIRENVICSNSTSGIKAGGDTVKSGWAADCKILNNTLYSNDAQKLGSGEIHIAKSHDLTINSNIVYTGAKNLAVAADDFGEKYIYRISYNNNLYYGPGGSRGLRFQGVGTGAVGLNMWQSKTQQDKSSRIADPKFVKAVENDFHLLKWSPAIDFGDPKFSPDRDETDYDGKARINGRGLDCGAFEY